MAVRAERPDRAEGTLTESDVLARRPPGRLATAVRDANSRVASHLVQANRAERRIRIRSSLSAQVIRLSLWRRGR